MICYSFIIIGGFSVQNFQPTTWSLTSDRTRNWVLQQKIEGETKESSYPKLIEMNGGGTGHNHELEMIRKNLQHVASKLQHLAQKASSRWDFSAWPLERAFLDKLNSICPSLIASQGWAIEILVNVCLHQEVIFFNRAHVPENKYLNTLTYRKRSVNVREGWYVKQSVAWSMFVLVSTANWEDLFWLWFFGGVFLKIAVWNGRWWRFHLGSGKYWWNYFTTATINWPGRQRGKTF